MSSFNDGQKWSLEMVIDPMNAFLREHSNPDPSSFDCLSLESFPDNGKCPLFFSQAGCLENELHNSCGGGQKRHGLFAR